MATLKYTASDDTLWYIPGTTVGVDYLIEPVGASLTVWWSGNGLRVEGVVLRCCPALVWHAKELLCTIGVAFSFDVSLPLLFLVRMALLGVWDRHRSESRPGKEFDDFSKKVCRFVRTVMIPPNIVKEMMKRGVGRNGRPIPL